MDTMKEYNKAKREVGEEALKRMPNKFSTSEFGSMCQLVAEEKGVSVSTPVEYGVKYSSGGWDFYCFSERLVRFLKRYKINGTKTNKGYIWEKILTGVKWEV